MYASVTIHSTHERIIFWNPGNNYETNYIKTIISVIVAGKQNTNLHAWNRADTNLFCLGFVFFIREGAKETFQTYFGNKHYLYKYSVPGFFSVYVFYLPSTLPIFILNQKY